MDTSTLTTAWAVDTGDAVQAAIALDLDEDGQLWLYTVNTLQNRTKGDCTIRRFNALTGEESWNVAVGMTKGKTQISGGMAQLVAIARALINDPAVLLMDEPMGAQDSFTRADLQDKLLEIRAQNDATMVLVTHAVDEAIYLSDRIVIMTPRPGRISEVLEVKLPHPRERGGVAFISLRREILDRFHLASAKPQPEYYI